MFYNIYDPQDIKDLINNSKRSNLDIQVQLFIKYMRTPVDKYSELYNQTVIQKNLNKNLKPFCILYFFLQDQLL